MRREEWKYRGLKQSTFIRMERQEAALTCRPSRSEKSKNFSIWVVLYKRMEAQKQK